MATISEALRIAVDLHQNNRLPEAATLYERILDADPTVADAWHLLGVLHLQTGDHSRAAGLIAKAIANDPLCAAYHDNIGSAERAAGRVDRAVAGHRRALALDPAWTKPLGNMGNALLDSGRAEAAAAALHRAVRLAPGQGNLRLRLADCLQTLGRAGEAEAIYAALDAEEPGQPDLLYRLGVSKLDGSRLMNVHLSEAGRLVDRGRVSQALAHFEEAARAGHADARKNCFGTTILSVQQGILDDRTLSGVAGFARSCLMRDPRDSTALAVVCYDLYRKGRLELAGRFFRKHARLFPADGIGSDFELLVWSLVLGDPRILRSLDGYRSPTLGMATHRTLAERPEDGRPILLIGCDDGYWRRFGADFLASYRGHAGSCGLHVHLVNPSDGTLEELARLAAELDGALSCSCETIDLSGFEAPVRQTYFASARFAVAQGLLRRGTAPVIQVDIDAAFLEDPGAAIAGWPAWDVSIMRDRRGRGPTRDFLAGFMAFNPTPAGRAFLDRVVAYIGWSFDRGRAFWTLDQAAPYCVHDWMARSGQAPSVVWHDFEAFPYMRFLAK